MEKGFYNDKDAYKEAQESLDNVLLKLSDCNRQEDRAFAVISSLISLLYSLEQKED